MGDTGQVGDVVILGSKVNDELEVFVDQELKYFGQPGVKNNRMAVRITRQLEEGVDMDG